MSILNKLTIKHLLLNKKRTIVSIIGIMLSTALMVGIGLVCSSLREYAIDQIVRYDGNYHAIISGVSNDKLDIIDNNNAVKRYYYDYQLSVAKIPNFEDEYLKYFYVHAANEDYFNELNIVKGDYPKNDNEIVISSNYGRITNYEIGDIVQLEYGKRTLNGEDVVDIHSYSEDEIIDVAGIKDYKIVGFVEEKYYHAYPGWGIGIYTKDMNESLRELDVYLLYKNPKKTFEVSEIIYKNMGLKPIITEEYEYYEIHYNQGLLAMYGVSVYENINDFIIGALSIVLGIISVACIIVIYNSFAISVMERKKQFGLFSSIGATKSQLKGTVFFEAVVTGGIGIVLGILASYIGIGLLIVVINNLLGSIIGDSLKLATYSVFIFIPMLFIVGTVIISAYLPARSASRISPIEVIRQNDDIKVKRKGLKTPSFFRGLFGVEGDIAYKNIKRNKKKYRITIISLFISIVAFIAFSSFLYYGITSTGTYLDEYDHDIVINYEKSYVSSEDLRKMNDIIKHPQVKKYSKSLHTALYKVIGDKSLYTEKYYKQYLSYEESGQEIQGDYYNLYNNYLDYMEVVVLSNDHYNQYKKDIGLKEDRPIFINKRQEMYYENKSNIRKVVETDIYNANANLNFEICSNVNDTDNYEQKITKEDVDNYKKDNCYYTFKNIYLTNDKPDMYKDLSYGGILIINEDMYNTYEKISNDYLSQVSNYLGYQIRLIVDEYDELTPLLEDLSIDSYYENYKETQIMQRNFILAAKIVCYGFIGLVTLIGVTSVFNTINTSINLRKREFAMLRSVGLTPHGFNKMIWYESFFFGFKALLYSLPIGIGLSYLIYEQFYHIVETPFYIQWSPIVVAIFGVFIIVLITMWYSTVKLKKENILEAIRMENI